MSKQIAEVLQKAFEAFGPNGENWIRGAAGDAPQCCSVSAFDRAGIFGIVRHNAYQFLSEVVGAKYGYLAEWNDTRTWPRVKSGWQKAIKEASAV
jgi:hypothetical protein